MDDFNGEVSCGEVLGTEPGEQAPDTRLSARCGGDIVFLREPGGVSLWSVLVHPGCVAVTLQVDSSCVSLLALLCNR